MSVRVEKVTDGVRLVARDGKYERWFKVPTTEVPELIFQLGQVTNHDAGIWPVYDH